MGLWLSMYYVQNPRAGSLMEAERSFGHPGVGVGRCNHPLIVSSREGKKAENLAKPN